MITKLILDDFLAHGHTELDLGPGVTVISGPNNSGKSSIVEALRCLAQNPSPRFFIRHGAKEARVSAVLEEGTMVTWVRRPKYAMYEVLHAGAKEPVTYAKFGRKTPEDVLDLLRLDNVFLEGINEDVDVHLGDQRRPVFLLDRPGSAMASFFASSTEATHLVAMQQLLKTRMAQAKRDDRSLNRSMQEYEGVLDALQPLPALRWEMGRAKEKATLAGTVRAQLPVLEAGLKNLRGYGRKETRLQKRRSVLGRALVPPEPEPVEALALCIERMAALRKRYDRLQNRLQRMDRLAPLPEVYPCKSLADLLHRRNVLREMQDRKTDRCSLLAPLFPAAEPDPTHVLDQTARRITRLLGDAARLRRHADVFDTLSPAREPFDTGALCRNVDHLRKCGTRQRHLMASERVLAALKETQPLEEVRELVIRIGRIRESCAARRSIITRLATYTPFPQEPALQSPVPGERLLEGLVKQIRQKKKADAKLALLARKEEDLRTRLNGIDICPLCGGHVEADRVLGMVEAKG